MKFKDYYIKLKIQQRKKKLKMRKLQRESRPLPSSFSLKNYTDANNYINRPSMGNSPSLYTSTY